MKVVWRILARFNTRRSAHWARKTLASGSIKATARAARNAGKASRRATEYYRLIRSDR